MCMGVTAGAYILTLFAVSYLLYYSANIFPSDYQIILLELVKHFFNRVIITGTGNR